MGLPSGAVSVGSFINSSLMTWVGLGEQERLFVKEYNRASVTTRWCNARCERERGMDEDKRKEGDKKRLKHTTTTRKRRCSRRKGREELGLEGFEELLFIFVELISGEMDFGVSDVEDLVDVKDVGNFFEEGQKLFKGF